MTWQGESRLRSRAGHRRARRTKPEPGGRRRIAVQEYVPASAEYQLSGITFAVLDQRLLMETDRTACVGEAACLAMREGTTATTAFLAPSVHLLPSWRRPGGGSRAGTSAEAD
ncbi:hypothetical protein [Streptomyces cyaneofuscatus]|uniref:hypothetical protein n=1 Tax=Streptomyces cyaneofuscatus TaxID=66883 RepID=UPI003663BCC0